ncbi:MAG: hypothetical protein DWQ46_15865 [Planctomycetota bacterium]|nr:MAG: hypothetical protein DWQ46_15865 [Planctomycetota bacterium]
MSGSCRWASSLIAIAMLAGCSDTSPPSIVPQQEVAAKIRLAISEAGSGESDDEGAVEAVRTGWATIKGRFLVEGTAPTPGRLTVNRDQEACAPGGEAPLDPSIKVAADGSLANVVVYIRGLSGENVHESAATPASDTVEFDQKQCVFLTHVCPLQVGQTLLILNSDSVGHNTKIGTRANPEINVTLSVGDKATFVPHKPEKVPAPVVCSIHPWMKAYVFPRATGYVSVSGEDGTFEIKNVPAGIDLSVQVWHETLKKFEKIDVNGEQVTWKRGAVKLGTPLEPDEVRELTVKIPAKLFGS